MDLICPRCGEPWDFDTIHEIAKESGRTVKAVSLDFTRRGCEAFGEPKCAPDDKADIRLALAELMGADLDGYAGDLEDFGLV